MGEQPQEKAEVPEKDPGQHYRKYYRGIQLDPFRLEAALGGMDAVQFTIFKKAMRMGSAAKDRRQDLLDIISAAERGLEMMLEDAREAETEEIKKQPPGKVVELSKEEMDILLNRDRAGGDTYGTLRCKKCAIRFTTVDALEEHLLARHGVNLSDEQFHLTHSSKTKTARYTPNKAQVEQKEGSVNLETFICEICGNKYLTREARDHHLTAVHGL